METNIDVRRNIYKYVPKKNEDKDEYTFTLLQCNPSVYSSPITSQIGLQNTQELSILIEKKNPKRRENLESHPVDPFFWSCFFSLHILYLF